MTYGGLLRIMSKPRENASPEGTSASTSAFRKVGAQAPVRCISSAKSCDDATASASSDISTATTSAPGHSRAIVHAMQPLPVHISSTLRSFSGHRDSRDMPPPARGCLPSGRRGSGESLCPENDSIAVLHSISVSGRGIRTEGLTLKSRP